MRASNSRAATPELPPSSLATHIPLGDADLAHPDNDWSSPSIHDHSIVLSETDTLAASSPELPPLSAPTRLEFVAETAEFDTASSTLDSDGTFYTASWGSPYHSSILPAGRHSGPRSRHRISSSTSLDDLDDSPNLQFGLSHLIPSRLTTTYEVTPTRPSTPNPPSPTDETPRSSTIISADTTAFPSRNLTSTFAKHLRSKIVDPQGNTLTNQPFPSDSFSRQRTTVQEEVPTRKGHPSRDQNRTLRQEDILPSAGAVQRISAMDSSKFARRGRNSGDPVTPTMSSSSSPKKTTHSPTVAIQSPPALGGRTTSNSSASGGRVRRRVIYKGKTCWITLPIDHNRGEEGHAPLPLSTVEVAERLKAFEDQGYDTRGFGNWSASDDEILDAVYAQNRPVYPDPADLADESRDRNFRIRIPNKSEWEAYVNFLTEQKLAALGVSLGGEPEESPLSRQTSSQFGHPFSPPLPTSSAGSHKVGPTSNVYPAGFVPGSSNHTSTRSIASPISSLGNPRISHHMHRHSVYTSPPNVPLHAISPLGFTSFSPQSFTNPHMAPSTGSPAFSSGAADMRSPISPLGPMIDNAQSFPFAQRDELWLQLQRQQQQQLLNQQQQHRHQPQVQPQPQPLPQPQPQQLIPPVRSASTLEEVPEADTDDDSPPSQARSAPPEIVNPKPGHRHNISAKLEENVSKIEYSFKKTIEKTDGAAEKSLDEVPTPESAEKPVPEWRRNAPVTSDDSTPPQLSNKDDPQHLPSSPPELPKRLGAVGRTYELEYGNETASSDIEANNSEADFEKDHDANFDSSALPYQWENDPTFKPKTSATRPTSTGHSSVLSFSGLNVEAKEFNPTANPSATFNPAIFSSSSFGLHPERAKPFVPKMFSSSATSTPAAKATPKSTFNANAPAFSPSGFGGSILSKSEFSFSTKGPSFNPTAPSFQPGSSILSSDQSFSSPTSDDSSRIFSNINFADLVEKSNISKAVPIVPLKSGERELHEDETGRLAIGNAKRARRVGDDWDEAPRFAIPSMPVIGSADFSKSIVPGEETDDAQTGGVNEMSSTLILEDDTDEIEDGAPKSDETAQPHNANNHTPETQSKESSDAEDSLIAEQIENKVLLHSLTKDGTEHEASSSPEVRHSSRSITGTNTLSPFAEQFEPIVEQIAPETPPLLERLELKERRASDPILSPPSSAFKSDGDYIDMHVERIGRPISSPPGAKLPSSVRYYDDMEQPTFNEIDAIMQQMNDEGSDFGVEREMERDTQSWPESSLPEEPMTQKLGIQPNFTAPMRSDAPSPSPRRGLLQPTVAVEGDSGSVTHDPFSDGRAAISYESPIHQSPDQVRRQVSDWDDFSSGDEKKILSRAPFVHSHVSQLIKGALLERLNPLEKQLQSIQAALATIPASKSIRHIRSRATMDSDADDEDDDVDTDFHSRGFSRSPIRDRKMEKFRAVVQEVLANHQRSLSPVPAGADLSGIFGALEDFKTTMTQSSSQTLNPEELRAAVSAAILEQKLVESIQSSVSNMIQLDDIKAAVEASMGKQMSAISQSREINQEDSSVMAQLLEKNAEAMARAAEEAEARKSAERREGEAQRLLKLAEEELELFKSSSTDDGQRLRAYEERYKASDVRASEAETLATDLKSKAVALSESNAALKATLEEYRLSHSKWREDIDNANREKEKLAGAFGALKLQADEAIRIRETMRDRLEKLQVDAANASAKLIDERSRWQRADAEHRTRYELLQHRITAESRTRERIETEMERLEVQEREAMKLRHVLDHMQQEKSKMQTDIDNLLAKERENAKIDIHYAHLQKENAKLEELVDSLRNERDEHERTAEKYAREHREAREAGRIEVQRTAMSLQADVEAANHQVNIVRAELEAEVARVRAELDNAKMEIDTAKAKHEIQLEQEADSKRDAIREVIEGKTSALQDQKESFEERLEEMRKQHRRDLDHLIENKNQSETFLREAHGQRQSDMEQLHQRALDQGAEDRERLEANYNSRLALADNRIELLQDKIAHLEQKLDISKSAAHAAVQAAQSAKAPIGQRSATIHPVARNEGGISSQALRESIAVLQDQLQEREVRLEALETELAAVDKSLPEKVRAREVEIGWLRELLGVRIDDLAELVNLLARDDFDREAVRNAAIRIRTGLQMEQHDKERANNGGGSSMSAVPGNLAASLQSFASPRAAQLARVIGEWRNTSATPSRTSPGSQTQPSFLAGLMTPPATSQRRASAASSAAGPSTSLRSSGTRQNKGKGPVGLRPMPPVMTSAEEDDDLESEPPRTPPLLEREAYDQDAETGRFSSGGFYDDEGSTVEGTPRREKERVAPFGGDIVRP